MAKMDVHCPVCDTTDIVKYGISVEGKQRYQCKNEGCSKSTFILDYSYTGCFPEIKNKIIEMALNGSGIRDTARVLDIGRNTVISELKKKASEIQNVNHAFLKQLDGEEIEVVIYRVDEAEIDEMWSFVGSKENQRWLWHAIDRISGKVLAYVFGKRKDEVFLKLKLLLEPFGIKRFYTDDWGAYERHIQSEQHIIGKRNTQKIERKHLTLRTRIKRLARKTICFSKLEMMHDIVIGLFINRYEFCAASI
jgi:insertion element IS1 protein InsB